MFSNTNKVSNQNTFGGPNLKNIIFSWLFCLKGQGGLSPCSKNACLVSKTILNKYVILFWCKWTTEDWPGTSLGWFLRLLSQPPWTEIYKGQRCHTLRIWVSQYESVPSEGKFTTLCPRAYVLHIVFDWMFMKRLLKTLVTLIPSIGINIYCNINEHLEH